MSSSFSYMKRQNLKRLVCIAFIFVFYAGCGAKIKSADQVQSVFGVTETLGQKSDRLCQILRSRDKPPYLKDSGLASDACANAGVNAQDLKGLSTISFAAVRADGQKFSTTTTSGKTDQATQRLQTSVELWLNRGILGVVKLLIPAIRDKSNDLLKSNSASDQEEFQIKVLGVPEFSIADFSLSLKIQLTSVKEKNGLIDINNEILVSFRLLDNREGLGAATVETTSDAPKEKSFIKSARITVQIIPHAGDIYLGIVTDMTLHSFGVDEAVKQQFLKVLSDFYKKLPGLIDQAEQKSNTSGG